MSYYEDEDKKKRRRWAIFWLLLYFLGIGFLMTRAFDVLVPDPQQGAIVVEFTPPPVRAGAQRTATQTVPSGGVPQRAMTTTAPDAPELPVSEDGEQTPEPAPVITPAREVNQRALFPGNSAASGEQSSRGSGGGESSGTGFDLDGRYLVGALPPPAYDVDVEGHVVMRITVNSDGRVTSAVFEQEGSTTNHGVLVAAARAAAMRARFTVSEAEIQTGTITYIFRLN